MVIQARHNLTMNQRRQFQPEILAGEHKETYTHRAQSSCATFKLVECCVVILERISAASCLSNKVHFGAFLSREALPFLVG